MCRIVVTKGIKLIDTMKAWERVVEEGLRKEGKKLLMEFLLL